MIVTVTMNPSLDMAYSLPHLVIDDVNRVPHVEKTAGGKGLNVTRVLHQMNAEVLATGLIGGNIGKYITDQLDESNIQHAFYPIENETRNSIAILHDAGNQTELLESGPEITELESIGFLKKFEELIKKAQVLVISGSLPRGLPIDFYQKLIQKSTHIPTLLDTSGKSLGACLSSTEKPFLIKPNLSEIQEIMERSLTVLDLKEVLVHEKFAGIEWIVVSLGSEGAIAKHNDIFYRVTIPKIKVTNPVGSGDATIAGLAYGVQKQLDDESLLKTGMATGMLNAQESKTGWINVDNFDALFNEIKVEKF
jgi:tagatose 6-phosphate kinase